MSVAKKLGDATAALLLGLVCTQVLGQQTTREERRDNVDTDERAGRLKERDRYAAQARKLEAEGQLPAAIAAAEEALLIEKEVFGKLSLKVADSLAYLTGLHEKREEFVEVVRLREEVVDIVTRVPGVPDWQVSDAQRALKYARRYRDELDAGKIRCLKEARALSLRVQELSRQGRFREALGPARSALRIRREILPDETHPDYLQSLNDLAFLYHDLGEYVRSRRLLEQALKGWNSGKNHPQYAVLLVNLGVLHERSEEYTEAAKCCREALAIRKKLLGEKHPAYVRTLENLSNALARLADQEYRASNFDAAAAADGELLAARTKLLGEKHWRVTDTRLDVAHVERLRGLSAEQQRRFLEGEHLTWKAVKLEELENYREASEVQIRALGIWKDLAGEESRSYADGLYRLGNLEARQGEFPAAEQHFRRALEIQRKVLGHKHPDHAETNFILAACRAAREDFEEAIALLWKAEAIRKETLGELDPKYVRTVDRLASVYAEQAAAFEAGERFDEARKARQEVMDLRKALFEGQEFALREGLVRGPEGFGIKRWHLTDAHLALAQLELLRKLDGSERRRLAEADRLMRTAEELAGDGKADEAVGQTEKARDIRKEVLGDRHRTYADCLARLGRLRQALGDLMGAEKLLNQAARMRKAVLGNDHPDYLASLDSLSGLYAEAVEKCKARGDYPGARNALEEALAVETELHGGEHWRVTDIRLSLDQVERLARLTPDQRRRLAKAVQIEQEVQGLKDEGKYRDALKPAEEVRKELRDLLGENHRRYATALNNLGFLYEALGDYGQAGTYYRQAIELRKKVVGEKHPYYAQSLQNLGSFASKLGDYDRSEDLFQRALRIKTEALGEEDEDRATTLNSLGTLYLYRHRYSDAEPLLIEALKIRRHLLGKNDLEYARSLNNLAGLYQRGFPGPEGPSNRRVGAHDLAERLYREASAIWKAGRERSDYARCLDNLAQLYHSRGAYSDAVELYLEAQPIFALLGPEHPDYAISLHNLAIAYQAIGRPQDALAKIDQAMAIDQGNLRRVFDFNSETGIQSYLDGLGVRRPLDALVSMAHTEGAEGPAVEKAFTWVLRRKGLVLDALSRFRELQTLRAQDDTLAKRVREWREVRQRLANWQVKPPADVDDDTLRQLKQTADDLEAGLYRTLAEHRPGHFAGADQAEIGQVQDRLRKGTALVEVVRIRPYDFRAKGDASPWGPAQYFAFVLTAEPGARIRLIPLSGAEDLDRKIAKLCDPLGKRPFIDALIDGKEKEVEDKFRDESTALYRELFAPLQPALGEATLVYLSLEGELNRLPFEALVDGNGKYLIESHYRFAYLSSGRDLLRPAPGKLGRGTVVIAGPNFKTPAAERRDEALRLLKQLAPANRDYTPPDARPTAVPEDHCMPVPKGGMGYPALTASEEYVHALQDALRGGRYGPATAYAGKSALEEIFKALPPPCVLHVNTHGFFRVSKEAASDEEDVNGSPVQQGEERLSRAADPMFRSGFVLAGANQLVKEDATAAGAEDGFVTAEEVALLNFRGTELVFLDACQTGLGDVRLGEGIYGLRRAFLYAGARTLVTSLFYVPYQEKEQGNLDFYGIRELMREFYGQVKAGKGKLDALHQAQLEIIRQRKARQGAAHPFFWAGFVLVGDPE